VISVIFAHPYPTRSRACARLAGAIRDLPGLELRDLYRLYPDFDIDVAAEQAALAPARVVVWMHPVYWYTTPALLKHWFDKVLVKGWAYGPQGTGLAGKSCLWVATTGGDEHAYSEAGRHHHPFGAYAPVVEETARYCGMQWLDPFVVHGAHVIEEAALDARAAQLRERLLGLAG
jgi:glutathione-regulated potassium-efflux system ancillary protein KefF